MAQRQTVKFVKVPRERVHEIPEREKIYMADCLYIGESGTIYFVSDYGTPVDFNNNLLYNNNIKEKVSFIEPISKEEVESNPFLEGISFESSFENLN